MAGSRANAAFVYFSGNYSTAQTRLMGRHSATEGFLKAFVRNADVDTFYCYTSNKDEFDAFTKRVAEYAGAERPTVFIPFTRPQGLTRPGCLYRPGPNIGFFAWERRHFDQRAYSICGVTHTTAEQQVMDALGDLLLAPVQPWDAVVCTSRAVKAMVEHLIHHYADYLGDRLRTTVKPVAQLPLIPLGVDCQAFARTPAAIQAGQLLRQQYGIAPDDIVVLFVGRLDLLEKANPIAMYLGLEGAAQRTGKRIHLIQAGWFAHDPYEQHFKQGGAAFAPSVRHIYLDGRQPEVRANVWFAADIFATFSDNIQETFGLTPIEAMAAGLPVVGSDWDGYRDTVRDGLDGILVPTLMPPPGTGVDIALRHALAMESYSRYCGNPSQCISVDIPGCVEAFTRLIQDPELRRRLGESGRQRAEEKFDWGVIARQYQELWQELAARRQTEAEVAPRKPGMPANPLRDDPFNLFSSYPTAMIEPDSVVSLVPGANVARLAVFRTQTITNFAFSILTPQADVDALLERLSREGPLSVRHILDAVPRERQRALHRTLGWLAKINMVQIRKAVRSASSDAGAPTRFEER